MTCQLERITMSLHWHGLFIMIGIVVNLGNISKVDMYGNNLLEVSVYTCALYVYVISTPELHTLWRCFYLG